MFKDKNENYRLKIAFDFDNTLTDGLFFALAKHLNAKGHDVWIMTARMKTEEEYIAQCKFFGQIPNNLHTTFNEDIFEMAKDLGIENKIIFTNLADKSAAFKENGFDLLFDDDAEWHCNPVCENGGLAVNV